MRRLALLLVAVLSTSAIVATALPAGAGSTSFDDITVSAFGEAPTLTYTAPFATKKSAHRDVSTGDGDTLKKDQRGQRRLRRLQRSDR